VRKAQKAATDYVIARFAKRDYPKGFEVDQVCRQVIEQAGYGAYFTHRTGHNIYTKDHGPGAHIDSLETRDIRTLIPRTCFSIEPGIYLPNEFGVRLEYDLVSINDEIVQITGGIQESIVALL
jgi:Xaa-Pro aminopeptidase